MVENRMMVMRPPSESRVFLGMSAIIASPAMRRVLSDIERVAQTSASVLIQGESGSGKELVARAVHHYSLRCGKPWVDVSCAALPEHLVESELFGYERGAFSGADSAKPGLFELANLGTLFLDEVGELEPRMQVKLLRVLDGVPYFRLGGVRKVTVDARIVTATNQNLEEAIRYGRFRSDLYHRLAQVHLHVPPLRERPEDILPLAKFFLHQHDPSMRFALATVEAIANHDWPGNVRELRNTIVRAALLADGKELPPTLLSISGKVSTGQAAAPQANSLEAMEREMIFRVLSQTGGHHAKTAKVLGISRRTLTRKLKAYGIQNENHVTASRSEPERRTDRKAPQLATPVRG